MLIVLQLLQAVRDLIAKLLTTDPTRRYNVPDVRAHPWCGPELELREIVEMGESTDQ